MKPANTKKKKKLAWQQYIAIAFMMLMGAACGIVMVFMLEKTSPDTLFPQQIFSLFVLFFGMYAAMFFHIIVHEAGHLVFGLLTGYRFCSFRVASFLWLRENGKLTLKRFSLAGTGGQCLMDPPDMQDGKIPLVLYNLGGSLMNILFGALFLLSYFLFSGTPLLSPLLLMFAIIGFMTALMNGIPMRLGTVDNDGYNAFALSKNPEAVEAFWVQLKVNALGSRGIRLREMPEEWFALPTDEAMKNSMVAARGVLSCNRLMDEQRFEEADACMAHLLEAENGIVGLYRSLLLCDRMYVELIGENRREVIDGMHTKEQKKFMKAMKNYPSVLRTQYALALLSDRDAKKAQAILRAFEKTAKTYPYPHEIDAERDLMQLADSKAAALPAAE